MPSFSRLYHTLKYIPARQLFYQGWVRVRGLYQATPIYALFLEKTPTPEHIRWLDKLPHNGDKTLGLALAGERKLTLQNVTRTLPTPMNWQPPNDNDGVDALWKFELHYHDWLADLRAANARETAQELIRDWLLQCDSYQKDIWHAYPTSLRLVNWLQHGQWLLKGADEELSEAFANSIARQTKHLSRNLEFHLGANHLLKNIKALLFCGIALPEEEKMFWRGQKMLAQQLSLQVLPDGGHFERSPMYHVQVLQDVLDIHALYRLIKRPVLPELDAALEGLANALPSLRHADGGLILFADSVEKSAKDLDALQRRTGVKAKRQTLPDTRYAWLENKEISCVMDVGKVGPDAIPGHAHAGTLSIEVSIGSQRVLVNAGTYSYHSPKRNIFRATSAHNTVEVDGQNSADVWGKHRVGRRPRKVEFAIPPQPDKTQQCVAQHDGYKHLGITHHRSVTLDGAKLSGTDTLNRSGKSISPKVRGYFHIHPSVKCKGIDDSTVHLTLPGGKVWVFKTENVRLGLEDGEYAPHMNTLHPMKILVLYPFWPRSGPLKLTWTLKPKA